ncbi:Uncharacterised protein [Mycobacteroides abscessus subsp. abscessus]|nr:Uncharacterised protein [Mycobacteroides abscessus subsp. abscessus]
MLEQAPIVRHAGQPAVTEGDGGQSAAGLGGVDDPGLARDAQVAAQYPVRATAGQGAQKLFHRRRHDVNVIR